MNYFFIKKGNNADTTIESNLRSKTLWGLYFLIVTEIKI